MIESVPKMVHQTDGIKRFPFGCDAAGMHGMV